MKYWRQQHNPDYSDLNGIILLCDKTPTVDKVYLCPFVQTHGCTLGFALVSVACSNTHSQRVQQNLNQILERAAIDVLTQPMTTIESDNVYLQQKGFIHIGIMG